MAAYDYVSMDKDGRRHKGVIEADSERQARQALRERMLTPLSLREASGTGKRNEKLSRPEGLRVGVREISVLTRQLATLIESGLPVEQALQALSRQSQKPPVKSMLAAIRSQVLEGHSLAESLNAFPKSFSELYRTSVYAGERTGHLGKVLNYLADFTENAFQSRQKIMLALLYPAVLTAVSLLIIVFLLAYIVPGMIRVFSNAGHSLPLLTRGLIAISNFVQGYGLVVAIILLLGAIAARRMLALPENQKKLDRQMLRWPLFGKLIFEYSAARFASTLGMLQESGVPLLQGLEISSAIMDNLYMREKVEDMTKKVSEGISLSQAMEQVAIFPPVLVTMSASGEASGQLGTMLVRASAMLQRDAENRTAILLGLFEPLVLLVMGGVVLLLVLAIILPILNLNQLVQ